MKFLCLVYAEEAKLGAMSDRDGRALTDESLGYDDVLRAGGHFVVANALESVRTAATVRVRKRKVTITDGPFAETKEQLVGFILIDAKSRSEAVKLASKIPLARLGSIEVRAIRGLARSGESENSRSGKK